MGLLYTYGYAYILRMNYVIMTFDCVLNDSTRLIASRTQPFLRLLFLYLSVSAVERSRDMSRCILLFLDSSIGRDGGWKAESQRVYIMGNVDVRTDILIDMRILQVTNELTSSS